MTQELYILDAFNFLFRSYYAIGPMTNRIGESTHALFGFIRSVNKIIKDFSPKNLVAVFDGLDNKKQRQSIYHAYKAHRKKMPEDLVPQLEKVLEFCRLANIPHLSIPEVEADDTIGSIAKWAEKKGQTVYICSSDKDLCQLVSPHIFVINPHKDNLLIDRAKVKELFDVYPEQIVDFLAMTGDASDNIPGIEGFGPKTSASLLNEFGNLEEIFAHPDKIKGEKKQQQLLQGKENAFLSKRLLVIDTEVDFPKEDSFFLLTPPDLEKLKNFYHLMHFSSLIKELEPISKETERVQYKEETSDYHCIEDKKALDSLIEQLLEKKEICIDTETTDIRPMFAHLVGVGICTQEKKAYYIPLNGNLEREAVIAALKKLLENQEISFYGHNIKYDIHILLNEGISLAKISFDTILASYLLSPQNRKHNLDELTLENFGKVKIPIENLIGKGQKQISMQEVPLEKVCTYCCEDVDYTYRLKNLFTKQISKESLNFVFEKIELPLLPILIKMERQGIFLDTDKLDRISKDLSLQLEKLESVIYEICGESFNLNSPKQLSYILFEKMGIKTSKRTTTGYSTSADTLEALKEEFPVVKTILEYRTLEKLRSTYVDALPKQVHPYTKRIHCTFNQSVAATGRLSCQDPNLQNIPIRTVEGRKIREAFKPQLNEWSFLSADYSQIELRILAHLSEDPVLIKAFNEGEDIHSFTASLVFNVPLKEVTSEMRRRAKAVNFGILYGQQAFGLSQGLDINYKEAADFIDIYFKRYPKVKEFIEFCKEEARRTGKTYTLTGRQRPLPDIYNKNPIIRAAAERLAINTPLQGTAADLIKLAMIEIDKTLQKEPLLGAMILQIHDELLFESPDNSIERLGSLAKNTMEHVFNLKVPLTVHISIGKNWGEC